MWTIATAPTTKPTTTPSKTPLRFLAKIATTQLKMASKTTTAPTQINKYGTTTNNKLINVKAYLTTTKLIPKANKIAPGIATAANPFFAKKTTKKANSKEAQKYGYDIYDHLKPADFNYVIDDQHKVIFCDQCTALGHKINILVIEDDLEDE